MSQDPHFLRWSQIRRKLDPDQEALVAKVKAALEQSIVTYQDREWAAIPDMRGGVAYLVPLTLDRIDAWAARVWEDGTDNGGGWSLNPEREGHGSPESTDDPAQD